MIMHGYTIVCVPVVDSGFVHMCFFAESEVLYPGNQDQKKTDHYVSGTASLL